MKHSIGVIGGNQADPEIIQLAEEVGEEIAKADSILICGGRSGVMEAACKGAKKIGGTTVGILPGDYRNEANPFIDIPIVTGMGIGRNIIIVRSSEVVIALDGQYGTLSEISHALQLGIPVIGLKTWNLTKDIQNSNSAKEAVELAINLIK